MRFLFVTDSHVGAGAAGYTQQTRDPGLLPTVLGALAGWLEENPDVAFVLHGGDMVDTAGRAQIEAAAEVFAVLPVPTYLCLGNHDLDVADAPALWQRTAPQFFPGEDVTYSIMHEEAVVHVVPNHWGDTDFFWDRAEPQRPRLTTAQQDLLTDSPSAGRDTVIATHSPVFGVPAAQLGLPDDYHVPPEDFRSTITRLAERAGATLVLSGHSHINSLVRHSGRHYVSASALAETPFEFKDIRIGAGTVTMDTVPLLDRVSGAPPYNYDRTFVQGRFLDRRIGKPR